MQDEIAIDLGEALDDPAILRESIAQFPEGSDDITTHRDGALAVENAGRHQRAVFSEDSREFGPSATIGFDIAFCDITSFSSARVRRKEKSSGNRFAFRFTASLKRPVVTL